MSDMEWLKAAIRAANVNGSKYDLTDHYAEAIARAALEALMEPSEGAIRAFFAAGAGAAAVDEMGPRLGSGQGDYEEVPAWENAAETIRFRPRFQAMIRHMLEEGE